MQPRIVKRAYVLVASFFVLGTAPAHATTSESQLLKLLGDHTQASIERHIADSGSMIHEVQSGVNASQSKGTVRYSLVNGDMLLSQIRRMPEGSLAITTTHIAAPGPGGHQATHLDSMVVDGDKILAFSAGTMACSARKIIETPPLEKVLRYWFLKQSVPTLDATMRRVVGAPESASSNRFGRMAKTLISWQMRHGVSVTQPKPFTHRVRGNNH